MGRKAAHQDHSSAWIAQTWLSFFISISATSIGIIYLPVDVWIEGFMGMGMGMGMAFSLGSTVSLTKTQRDLHESKRLTAKLEEARVEKLLAEHDRV